MREFTCLMRMGNVPLGITGDRTLIVLGMTERRIFRVFFLYLTRRVAGIIVSRRPKRAFVPSRGEAAEKSITSCSRCSSVRLLLVFRLGKAP
jgi:hypothetical protein